MLFDELANVFSTLIINGYFQLFKHYMNALINFNGYLALYVFMTRKWHNGVNFTLLDLCR